MKDSEIYEATKLVRTICNIGLILCDVVLIGLLVKLMRESSGDSSDSDLTN